MGLTMGCLGDPRLLCTTGRYGYSVLPHRRLRRDAVSHLLSHLNPEIVAQIECLTGSHQGRNVHASREIHIAALAVFLDPYPRPCLCPCDDGSGRRIQSGVAVISKTTIIYLMRNRDHTMVDDGSARERNEATY